MTNSAHSRHIDGETLGSPLLTQAGSLERAAEIVTNGTSGCESEELAAQYACEALAESDYADDWKDAAVNLSAHLDVLAEAGAKFNHSQALTLAEAHYAQRSDGASQDTAHGLTFAEWLAQAGRSDTCSEYDLRAAWRAGENPDEYRADGEDGAESA